MEMAPSRRTESERLAIKVRPANDNDIVSMMAEPSITDGSPIAADNSHHASSPEVSPVVGSSSRSPVAGLVDVNDDESNYPAEDVNRWHPDIAANQDQYAGEGPDAPLHLVLLNGDGKMTTLDRSLGDSSESANVNFRVKSDELYADNNLDHLALLSETGMEVIAFGNVGSSAHHMLQSGCEAGDQHGGQDHTIKTGADLGINTNNNTSPLEEQKKEQTPVLKTTVIAVQESALRREFKLGAPRREEQPPVGEVRVNSPMGTMICSGGVCRLAVPSSQWTTKTKHDEKPDVQQGSCWSEKMPPVE